MRKGGLVLRVLCLSHNFLLDCASLAVPVWEITFWVNPQPPLPRSLGIMRLGEMVRNIFGFSQLRAKSWEQRVGFDLHDPPGTGSLWHDLANVAWMTRSRGRRLNRSRSSGWVPSLGDSLSFAGPPRHCRAGLSHSAPSALRWLLLFQPSVSSPILAVKGHVWIG